MRPSDWSGLFTLVALLASVVVLVLGRPGWAFGLFLLAAAGAVFTRWWSIRHPGPIPYVLRFTLRAPRGNHAPERLREILEPQRGERLLEIGPGIGTHALPIASAISPGGMLDIFDVEQRLLDDVMRSAGEAGITNIATRQGSAEVLPYGDATFDGAYLIGVLGEIPDGPAALRELHRVLKPGGRLVVGEVFFDPEFIRLGVLDRLTSAAGFTLDRKLGDSLTYLARFHR
jgi:ubiquinone/menaquinone biosynthesis C-methylase UbiE